MLDISGIADRMRQTRKKNNRTQQEIAAILGISRSNYSRIEIKDLVPNLKQIYVFAKEFNVDLNWLLFNNTPDAVYENINEEEGTYTLSNNAAEKHLKVYQQLIETLQGTIEDKNKIIELLQSEIERLKK